MSAGSPEFARYDRSSSGATPTAAEKSEDSITPAINKRHPNTNELLWLYSFLHYKNKLFIAKINRLTQRCTFSHSGILLSLHWCSSQTLGALA